MDHDGTWPRGSPATLAFLWWVWLLPQVHLPITSVVQVQPFTLQLFAVRDAEQGNCRQRPSINMAVRLGDAQLVLILHVCPCNKRHKCTDAETAHTEQPAQTQQRWPQASGIRVSLNAVRI